MLIIGNGECGTRAGFALRERGWDGPITLVGAEKLLPYERPPLSKSLLRASELQPAQPLCGNEDLNAAKIELIVGVAVTRLDTQNHHVELTDHREITYERVLLTTGASPRRLPVAGADEALYLRSYADAAALHSRLRAGTHVGVIGGGFIGLEVAANARQRGCDVTVIESMAQPMSRTVPAEIAALVAERHRREGVRLLLETSVVSLRRAGRQLRVGLSTGEVLSCDTVVAGVGAIPSTSLAQRADLAIDNGIRVDTRLCTSDPDVFAAGDCCSFPHPLYGNRRVRLECWRNAVDQASLAAANMLGADRPFASVPWFWSDQYELTIQIAGLPTAGMHEVVRHRTDGVDLRFTLAADGRLVAASAVGVGIKMARDIRLAERLIDLRARPDPAVLADSQTGLKTFLTSRVKPVEAEP